METFIWSSWFETGIDPVDEQHRKLVALLNDLAELDTNGASGQASLHTIVKALFDYIRIHFRDEAQLMIDYGIDKRHVDQHLHEHADFIHEISNLAKSNSADWRYDVQALHRYLVSWLSYHILDSDQSMARQLKHIRAGKTPEEALKEDAERHNHGLNALQSAMISLYEIVNEQNRSLRANNTRLDQLVTERTADLEAVNAGLLKEQQRLKDLNDQLEQAHNQLLQSEKMAAIGQLAAGVAHEINNPIGYVNSNLGTLKTYVERMLHVLAAYSEAEKFITDPASLARLQATKQTTELDYLRQDIIDLLQESREGLNRVTQIVQDLKDFSHVDNAEWDDADLNRGLDSTLNVIWNEVKYKAQVVKDYGDLPLVRCSASQINQVFMNLIVNASHAIQEKGTITLRTRHENNQIMIEIADTGSGMPPEVMTHIFEPFFTTKPVGKGTGLGLSLSYDIIKKHGGHIDVSSEPGCSTSFKIWLPLGQMDSQS